MAEPQRLHWLWQYSYHRRPGGAAPVAEAAPAQRLNPSPAPAFPNPSPTGRVLVPLPAGPAHVTIRNAKGTIVRQLDATGPATIPVQLDQPPGLYYLQVAGAAEPVVTPLTVE